MLAVQGQCFEPKLGYCLPTLCDAGPHSAWRQTRHGNYNGLMLAQTNIASALGERLNSNDCLTACTIESAGHKGHKLMGHTDGENALS